MVKMGRSFLLVAKPYYQVSVRRLGSYLNGKIKFVWYRFLLSVVSVEGPGTIVLGVVFRICTITGSPNRGVCSFVMNQEQHRCLL